MPAGLSLPRPFRGSEYEGVSTIGNSGSSTCTKELASLLGDNRRLVRMPFVTVLEGATALEPLRIAEDIRAAFEAKPTDVGADEPLAVTVSAGCAQLGSDRKVSAGLAMADVWLAQAKRAGRNQVVGL